MIVKVFAYFFAFLINLFLLNYIVKLVAQLRKREGRYFDALNNRMVPLGVIRVLGYIAMVNVFVIALMLFINILLLVFFHKN